MGYVILFFIAVLVFVYVVLPLAGIALAITIALSVIYALFISTKCFGTSLSTHANPYTTYVDSSENAQPGTRRNYFFGPGYHQIKIVTSDAVALQKHHISNLNEWKEKHTGKEWFFDIWFHIFFLAAAASTFVLGFAWTSLFSMALAVALGIGILGFFTFYIALLGADRLYLLFRSISSRCDTCKRTLVVPSFACSSCGLTHTHLVPGPYGVLKRTCACGTKLPTTIFFGRSKLQSSCTNCGGDLAASDARQFGIQLVGNTDAGKTTFLTSFWHEYREAAARVPLLETIYNPQHLFDELEDLFSQGQNVATSEMNASMFSAVHRLPGEQPLQFALYDIAGEAFLRLDDNAQQHQFRYCEGLLLVIDPTKPSDETESATMGFLNAFKALAGKSASSMSNLPVAVVITKADLYKKEVGLVKIRAVHRKKLQSLADKEIAPGYQDTSDDVCRTFLVAQGFSNLLNILDSEFTNLAIFPVSAMGHKASDGTPYEPWGVMQAAFWLLNQGNREARNYFDRIRTVLEESIGNIGQRSE